MKNIKITDLNLETDKPAISRWDQTYGDQQEYLTIRRFILEEGIYLGMDELIETNFERIPIGTDEVKKALIVKTDENEIVGFIICQVYDIKTNSPTMFLQYIVINPEFQQQGYASEIFNTLFDEPKKYLGAKPKEVFAYVHPDNSSSIALFKKYGFDFVSMHPTSYFRAEGNVPAIKKIIEQERLSKNKN